MVNCTHAFDIFFYFNMLVTRIMPNLIVAQMIVAFISFFIIYTAVNKSIKYDFRVDDNDNDWIENEHYA